MQLKSFIHTDRATVRGPNGPKNNEVQLETTPIRNTLVVLCTNAQILTAYSSVVRRMLSLLVICVSLALAGASASPRGCDCVYDNDLGEVKQTESLLQLLFVQQ